MPMDRSTLCSLGAGILMCRKANSIHSMFQSKTKRAFGVESRYVVLGKYTNNLTSIRLTQAILTERRSRIFMNHSLTKGRSKSVERNSKGVR